MTDGKKPIVQQGYTISSSGTTGGDWLMNNLKLIIGLVVILGAALLSFLGYRYHQAQVSEKVSISTYQFMQGDVEAFTLGESSATDLLHSFRLLTQEYGNHRNLFAPMIQVVDLVYESYATQTDRGGALRETLEAKEAILAAGLRAYRDDFSQVLIGLRLGQLLEDLGRGAEAIAVYEQIQRSGAEILSGKIYFSLGRLYLDAGNLERARLSFEYLVNNRHRFGEGDEQFVRMAEILMAEYF